MVCTVKIVARGSWNFELVHIILITLIVLLGMLGLHCLFYLVMKNACSRQVFQVVQKFLDYWIAECLVWGLKIFAQRSWNFELVHIL